MSFNRIATLANRMLSEHIANAVMHITAEERALWNDKSYLKSADGSITLTMPSQGGVISIEGHGHGIADIEGLSEKLAAVLHWKGVKASVDALPATGNESGDVWGVGTDEYVWNGSDWEKLGTNQDFGVFALKTDLNAAIAQEVIDRDAAIKVVSDALAADKAELDGKIGANTAAIAKEAQDRAEAVGAINGASVKLTGYTPVDAIDGDAVTIEATDSVNDAFRAVVGHLNTLEEISGGNTGDLTKLTGRVTANETSINNINTTLTGFSTESTVAAGIAAAKGEAIEAAATDASTKAGNAKSEAIAAAASDATTKADAAQAAAIAAAATDATTKADAAQAAAIAAAATDATTKAGNAKSEAIAAAETKAGELDAALKSDIEGTISANNTTYVNRFGAVEGRVTEVEGALTGFSSTATVASGIATAKGEAIADAEGKLATAKAEIDGRLDALEAVTDHGAEYVNGTVAAADIKADLLAYGMRVTYTPVSGASFTLPAAADLKGRSAQVNILVKAGGTVTVGDGSAQSETFTAPADCDMFYVFELVMTGQDTAAWYLAI